MRPVRVLIVEDSLTVRKRLVEILRADADLEIVGEAVDGKQAIDLCRTLRPDVVTLDMMLPVMSGLAVTEYIMAHFPTPILVVSASANRGELHRTYEALAAGAVDVLEKPRGTETDGAWETTFRASVKMVARIKVITHLRARLSPSHGPRPLGAPTGEKKARAVVAIGASTGGPGALVEVLRDMPAPFPVPILLVLHIGKLFGSGFAEWLDQQTRHSVSLAEDGESLSTLAGQVRVAPADKHLVVRGNRLRITNDPERHSCRPSVDVLFESIATEYGASAVACLLTGMGRDGAAGMLSVRVAGGATLAQDEATSVVYGMPREAALLGGVERVLPLGELGGAITALASGS